MSAEPPRTLPAWAYRSPEFFQAERREIFTRGWLLVGHVSQLREPGDYVSMTSRASRSRSCAARTATCGPSRTSAATARARVLDGAGNCGKAHALPLPRLDVRPRRAAARDPREDRVRRVRQGRERPVAAERRRRGRVRVREPQPRARAAQRLPGPVRVLARALPARAAGARPGVERRPSDQLEELDRQLPRGLPHPGRPPRPVAFARLQAVFGGDDRRARLDRPQPDARQGLPRLAGTALPAAHAADAGPARAREPGVELHLRVPRRHGEPLP